MDLFATEIMEYFRKTCVLLTDMNASAKCYTNNSLTCSVVSSVLDNTVVACHLGSSTVVI